MAWTQGAAVCKADSADQVVGVTYICHPFGDAGLTTYVSFTRGIHTLARLCILPD
ncbi:MAG: hypothetical protein ACYC6N_17670 [Pirellulaceae bacterium]